MGDDCFELRTLRRFRDHYVKQLPRGPAELNHYYQLAPHIVQTIDLKPDRQTIYEEIYTDLIEPAVQLIARGANAPAYALYRSYTLRLARRLNLDPRASLAPAVPTETEALAAIARYPYHAATSRVAAVTSHFNPHHSAARPRCYATFAQQFPRCGLPLYTAEGSIVTGARSSGSGHRV